MATNKRISDLTDYTAVLPYASEIFGVYQPMIGWKSKRTLQRMNEGISKFNASRFKTVLEKFQGISKVEIADIGQGNLFFRDESRSSVEIGKYKNEMLLKFQNESILLRELSNLLLSRGDKPVPNDLEEWKTFINADVVGKLLQQQVFDFYRVKYATVIDGELDFNNPRLAKPINNALQVESAIGKALIELAEHELENKLKDIFFTKPLISDVSFEELFNDMKMDSYEDPFHSFDPKGNIKENVSISPIGIVHLYRQYFFELDTFLGTPVGHVWLSPGSSVELIEISTRKVIEEKYTETQLETIQKKEISLTEQEDISTAIKTDDRQDSKLGFATTVNQSWGSGNFSATGKIDMDQTQQTARELANKKMRNQSEKLSSEIRQNFKSTFKTITEYSDTNSKRYVLNNTTHELINYEMRRKMRQVGVQVQDIGSYLCWQTFVDDPGKELGLPNLIHIAKATDIDGEPKQPDKPVIPKPTYEDYTIQIPFVGTSRDNDDKGELYIDGKESNEDDEEDKRTIKTFFQFNFSSKEAEYTLDPNYSSYTTQDHVEVLVKNLQPSGKVDIHLKNVHFYDRPFVTITLKLKWNPNPSKYDNIYKEALLKYQEELTKFTEKKAKAEKDDYINAVKDRVTLASHINKRKFENLREEERTIIYRKLIKALMTDKHYKERQNIASSEYGTFHILSELINAVFDIDKMLYFVAPEWWRPRKHSKVFYGDPDNASYMVGTNATWNNESDREDNYYITEKSAIAPLGSSLGWLLQLDGDDLRNAFLNAPWVKAVIPIRPGKEKAALNWLEKSGVEGSDGLDDAYNPTTDELIRVNVFLETNKVPKQFTDAEWESITQTTQPNPISIRQALDFLCAEVSYKEASSKVVSKYPKEEINDDNKVLATPLEKVYEHGFYPLKGGFKAVVEDYFETISQWIEVLPTDQIVPVEVKYDPKTGRQK